MMIILRNTFFALMSLIVFVLCACSDSPQIPSAPHSITDFTGAKIYFDKPVKRIVCLIESALSDLYMLGAGESVVAVSSNVYDEPTRSYYSLLDSRIKKKSLPAPGSWDFINLESVLSVNPDLVIIWAQQEEAIRALRNNNIRVYGVMLYSFNDVFKKIEDLGKITGHHKRALSLIDFTKNATKKFSLITPKEKESPRVYYMWAQGILETSGKGSTVDDAIELAGGKNIFSHIRQEHIVVNVESIIQFDPEIIVMWYNHRLDPSHILSDRRFRTISAVHHKRVHEFPDIFLCDLWTLKFVHAVALMTHWFYPELYTAKNLQSDRTRIFKFIYGRNF